MADHSRLSSAWGSATASRSEAEGARARQKGHAVLEFSLLAPWLIFLFAGAFDLGFYTYSLICTENAARVAAFYTSSTSGVASDSAGACQHALPELNAMSNVRGLSTCNSLPVIVSAASVTGVDGNPASNVSVTYQSPQLIPIPGVTGQLTVTRTVQMRVKP